MNDTPDRARQRLILTEAADLVDAGLLVSIATKTLNAVAPESLREAHALSEHGTMVGKIVLPGIGK